MFDPISFIVGLPIKESKEKRSITLDSYAMTLLGVKEGDVVHTTKRACFGISYSPEIELRVIGALPQDKGKKIVRLTSDVEEFRPGDTILVYTKS
ncbi:MAG: hypothetical protein JTT14_01635 [Candidatus Brockarchaeota archaeon]|nr:hypothetical protein [Candidatus Brockarchaeota archaeon]